MLDWKILVSAFIALLVVSFILFGGFGAGGMFSDAISAVSNWFGSSPFGDLVTPDNSGKTITLTISPKNMTMKPDKEVGIETGSMNLTGFEGEFEMDFESGRVTLSEENSKLRLVFRTGGIKISGLVLSDISMHETKFTIKPNMTTSNGTIHLTDFFGSAVIMEEGLELHGNATKVSATIGDLDWELS